MDAYTVFAEIYDEFMDDIPYDEWSRYINGLLKENGISDGEVVELGCGTGKITRRLTACGYDMIGVDMSEDMLVNARAVDEENGEILYLLQDMRELKLCGTVRAAVSVCDSMNYILSLEDLTKVLKNVNNYLDSHGVFIFDMKTEHFYRDILGDSTQTDNREDAALIWENEYDVKTKINSYYLTIFIAADEDADEHEVPLFERYQELHEQRAYSDEEVIQALKAAGMRLVARYDSQTHLPVREDSERVYYVAGRR